MRTPTHWCKHCPTCCNVCLGHCPCTFACAMVFGLSDVLCSESTRASPCVVVACWPIPGTLVEIGQTSSRSGLRAVEHWQEVGAHSEPSQILFGKRFVHAPQTRVQIHVVGM